MIYNIYHSQPPYMFLETTEGEKLYVGHVEANSLEQAYSLSQNHEWPWNLSAPCRSTSVGDVIECDGKFHMVSSIGFTPVCIETDDQLVQ